MIHSRAYRASVPTEPFGHLLCSVDPVSLTGLALAGAGASAGAGLSALLSSGTPTPAPPPATPSPEQQPTGQPNTPKPQQPTFLGALATPQGAQSGTKSLLGA